MVSVHADFERAPPGFHVLCRSRELQSSPLSSYFAGVPCVLFRDAEGRARALVDRCPHRGVALSRGRVERGTLACPYHGYRYDGAGRCVHLPGLAADARIPRALCAPALHVVEQDGFVWAQASAWGQESLPPRLPYLVDPDYHTMSFWLAAQGELIDGAENFLDATHTHYVHRGLIRSPAKRRLVDVRVRREGALAEAQYVARASGPGGSSGLMGRLLTQGIDGRFGRFLAPSVAQLEYRQRGTTAMVISALYTPRREGELSVYAVVTTRHVAYLPSPLVKAVVRALFEVAVRQDARVLALQAAGKRLFSGARPVISPTDVLRPHMEYLLQKGPSAPLQRELTLAL